MLSRAQRSILRWTIVHRLLVLATLFFISNLQSSFDSSAFIQLRLDATSSPLSTLFALPLLRWDSLHFLAMASPRPLPLPVASSFAGQNPSQARGGGTQFEHSLAFQPGIVWMLQILGSRSSYMDWSPTQAVLLTSALACAVSTSLPLLLFSLTKSLSGDEGLAQMSGYLSILSPSPCTLVTPTPESFFSFFALLGHLSASSYQQTNQLYRLWLSSTFYSLATAFRANGVLLLGFLLWQLFWQQTWHIRRPFLLLAPILVSLSALPLVLSQVFAYSRFCTEGSRRRVWCDRSVASVYTFVQDHYWDVGLFRYWSGGQIPNWLLAAPVVGLASAWLWTFYRAHSAMVIKRTFTPWKRGDEGIAALDHLIPHAHFTTLTLLMLVLHSHVQIALRFASPGGWPAVWWGASQVLLRRNPDRIPWLGSRWSEAVLAYLLVWNVASVALYAGFYPPA